MQYAMFRKNQSPVIAHLHPKKFKEFAQFALYFSKSYELTMQSCHACFHCTIVSPLACSFLYYILNL